MQIGIYTFVENTPDPATGQKIAAKHGLRAFGSLAETAAASDAVNVVTPTSTHFELARTLLEQGKHVLIEKPMTHTIAEAIEMARVSKETGRLVQVGSQSLSMQSTQKARDGSKTITCLY
jgi:predicted dehydrogenase